MQEWALVQSLGDRANGGESARGAVGMGVGGVKSGRGWGDKVNYL